MSYEFKAVTQRGAALEVIGSVEDVIAGRVANNLLDKRFDARDYLYGFEVAAPSKWSSLGEALLVNGMCYASDTSDDNNGNVIYGREFVSNGIFLVPQQAPIHSELVGHWPSQAIFLDDLYGIINDKLQRPFVFVGLINYAPLHSTAITKAPINQQNIFDNSELYYQRQPTLSSGKCSGFIMGAAANFNDKTNLELREKLKVVLYDNPIDRQASRLSMHSHSLVLNSELSDEMILAPEHVTGVRHVLNEQTRVNSCRLKVYLIEDIKQLFKET